MLKHISDNGLWFPIGLGVGFSLMVLWNFFFIYTAIQTAPEVREDYTNALQR